jgi:hypothetical protein
VLKRYREFLASPDAWILNRLVLPLKALKEGAIDRDWRLTVLVEDEPGPLPRQVQTLEVKLPHKLSLPTYCEAPIGQVADAFVKFRAGGLTPETVLGEAAARRLPFKATAGLHHALRSLRPLTDSPDSPQAVMHGFLNLFLAAAFAWHGAKREVIFEILNETDPRAFQFGERAVVWNGRKLSTQQIAESRRDFAHSFGSCSFEEPVRELRELGLI